jgi:transposase
MNSEPFISRDLWERIPPEARAYIRALETRVAALEATLAPLREQLKQHSRTSSRPPSSDPPQALVQRLRRAPSGRRPGGQPGHEGHARELVPVEQVAVVIPVKPERCWRCQQPLQGEDWQPKRHQVAEIPPMQPGVMEYQLPQLVCSACGAATRAEVPAEVPVGGFGPRLQAITAWCTGAYHRSKRTTQTVLKDLCGVSLGLGTMAHLEQATVRAVAAPVAGARAYVPQQPAAYLDETGGREGRQRAWLWTAVTAGVTVCVVRLSRRAAVAHELLGERFWGYVVTDRWSAYTWYPTWRRQVCWAHLRRDIEAMSGRGGPFREIGEALQVQVCRMVHWWHRVRDGTLAHTSFACSMRPIRREVERLLDVGQTCGVPKTEGVCREILKVRQAWWTFVRHEGVEPTNNAAERAIRPGVLWRKGRFGTQSPEGSRFVEAMMTVVTTLKPQHRPVLDYLTATCEAAMHDEPAPSLLPTPTEIAQLMYPAA